MDLDRFDEFEKDAGLILVSLLIFVGFTAASNAVTPDEPVRVGMVEVQTECYGLNAGICMGIQRQTHQTYNYDNYEEVEQGTENYYRKVESELMVRAYRECDQDMEGYEWTSEVNYNGRSAEEWRQNENIQLLPCENTFHRDLKAAR